MPLVWEVFPRSIFVDVSKDSWITSLFAAHVSGLASDESWLGFQNVNLIASEGTACIHAAHCFGIAMNLCRIDHWQEMLFWATVSTAGWLTTGRLSVCSDGSIVWPENGMDLTGKSATEWLAALVCRIAADAGIAFQPYVVSRACESTAQWLATIFSIVLTDLGVAW
jgi:hypothetical protein